MQVTKIYKVMVTGLEFCAASLGLFTKQENAGLERLCTACHCPRLSHDTQNRNTHATDYKCRQYGTCWLLTATEDTNSDERVSYTEFIRWLFHGSAEAGLKKGTSTQYPTISDQLIIADHQYSTSKRDAATYPWGFKFEWSFYQILYTTERY